MKTINNLICLFVIWFIASPIQVNCQYGFKKVIDYDDAKSLNFDDIELCGNKVYISGNVYLDSLNLWGQNIAAFDTNGLLLWQKTFFDPNKSSHIANNSPTRFFITPNNSFIMPFYFYNRNNLGLFIIDSIGNKTSEAEFLNTELNIFPGDVKLLYNNIYIFGTIQRTNYRLDNYIIKTDLVGNFKWIKYFGSPSYQEEFGDVLINNDGTFTISSTRYSDDFYDEPYGSHGWKKPWILTLDTTGTIINQWLGDDNDKRTLGGGPFYRMKNGDWIIISQEYKGVFLNGAHFSASTPTITKLNSEHILDWKLYLADYTGFWDRLLDLDFDSVRNEFVAVGHRVVYYSEDYSELEVWAVKFTSEGEIIWNKSDTIWSDRINEVGHFTSGLDISLSGSIYLAGTIEHEKNPNRSYGWILKMNPNGCFDTICSTTSLKETINTSDQIILYPNPARDYFNILQTSPKYTGTLILYDTFGRIVKRVNIDQEKLRIEIDFVPGVYFYAIYKGNLITTIGKLLVD